MITINPISGAKKDARDKMWCAMCNGIGPWLYLSDLETNTFDRYTHCVYNVIHLLFNDSNIPRNTVQAVGLCSMKCYEAFLAKYKQDIVIEMASEP